MTSYCAGGGEFGDIAVLMSTVDCHVAAYVASAYAGLFGQSGSMLPALVGALTIYVALYGYRLLSGGGILASDLVKRFIALGFVLAFATNWPAYQTVFVNTITGGAEEIAGMMSEATAGRATSSVSIAGGLDAAIDEMTRLAGNWSRQTPLDAALPAPGAPAPPVQSSPAAISAANMLWISATLFGVASAGALVVIKASLAFLLALGPVFLMLGVFPGTRGLFEGWLRTIVAGSLALAFTLLATSGALAIIAPILAEIAGEQALGVNNVEPVFALTIACVVFAMLVRQIVATTARLTAAWRLPGGEREGALAARDAAPAPTASSASVGDARIVDLVASIGRPDHALPARAAIAASQSSAPFDGRDASDPRADIRRAPRAYRGFGSSGRRIARGLS